MDNALPEETGDVGYFSPNRQARDYDDHISALRDDLTHLRRALALYIETQHLPTASEIKETCHRIIADLPFTPYVQPYAFKVDPIDLADWLVTCVNCDNGHIVHGPTWVKGSGEEESRSTRVCPYCAEESLVVDKRPQYERARR